MLSVPTYRPTKYQHLRHNLCHGFDDVVHNSRRNIARRLLLLVRVLLLVVLAILLGHFLAACALCPYRLDRVRWWAF